MIIGSEWRSKETWLVSDDDHPINGWGSPNLAAYSASWVNSVHGGINYPRRSPYVSCPDPLIWSTIFNHTLFKSPG